PPPGARAQPTLSVASAHSFSCDLPGPALRQSANPTPAASRTTNSFFTRGLLWMVGHPHACPGQRPGRGRCIPVERRRTPARTGAAYQWCAASHVAGGDRTGRRGGRLLVHERLARRGLDAVPAALLRDVQRT